MNLQLIIPAAGSGVRLGLHRPKAFVDLEGKPLFVRTIERFLSAGVRFDVIVVAPESHLPELRSLLQTTWPDIRMVCIAGGEQRQDSVWNGLCALSPDTDIVMIHDAARPFVSVSAVQAAIEAAAACGASTVAIPAIDTVLVGDADDFLVSTPDRKTLWACQTPQVFRTEVILEAHRQARKEGYYGTDDASLVRRMGGTVKLVPGSPANFKVTTPLDLAMARMVIREGLA